MEVRTKKQEVRKRNVGLRSKRFEVRSYMLEVGSKTSDVRSQKNNRNELCIIKLEVMYIGKMCMRSKT